MENSELNEQVEIVVLGNPKPAPMTYRAAEKQEGGNASCFSVHSKTWKAEVDWGTVEDHKLHGEPVDWQPSLNYAEDPEASLFLVEKMREEGYGFVLDGRDGKWKAYFSIGNRDYVGEDPESSLVAIAKAALLLRTGFGKDR